MTVTLAVVLFSASSTPVRAQDAGNVAASSTPHRRIATIIYAGLGGAVLGLSTLSFYGQPQEKLANIAIGAAVGVIAGTAYVTYEYATSSSNSAEPDAAAKLLDLSSQPRFASSSSGLRFLPLQWRWTF